MEGIIYILTNRAMPDYIKIGFTARADIKARLKELYSTGVPFPYELHYAVKVTNAKNTETMLHQIFSVHRENMDREFFRMDPERAMLALKLTGGIVITLEDSEIYEKEEIEIIEKSRQAPAPAFKFSMLGIKEGEILTFSRDENITCAVISDNKVSYKDQEYSLSALAKDLLQYKYGVQGPLYWLYKGKTLSELRNEKEREISEE